MPIKVNILQYSGGGKGYYRLSQPYEYINKHYSDIDVTFFKNMPINNDTATDLVTSSDIIVTHGAVKEAPKALPNILRECKRFGKVSVYDIDDKDWEVPPENPIYHIFKQEGLEEMYRQALLAADVVTTTTSRLANLVREFNQNVEVLPNAIDYDYYYWNLPKDKNDGYLRVSIICGSSHLYDLKLIEGIGKWLIDTFDNVKFVLGGYDSKILGNPVRGTRPLAYDDSPNNIWYAYKEILFGQNPNWEKIEILRTQPVEIYPILYRNSDIVLAPLRHNKFNAAKSNLKLIEASARGIPVIASDIWQYREDISSGWNSYLVRSNNEWKTFLTKLINDKELRLRMGQELQKKMKEKYSIEVVSETRANLIRKLYNRTKRNTIQDEKIMDDALRHKILEQIFKKTGK